MITIYTDGSCIGNPGPGGWAYLILKEGLNDDLHKAFSSLQSKSEYYFSNGAEPNTTNNRMELMACIQALKVATPHGTPITLYTDSTYVKNGITQWILKWRVNGWKSSSGPVKNQDLWKELDKLNQNVSWNWVKAHANNPYNNAVDELARH